MQSLGAAIPASAGQRRGMIIAIDGPAASGKGTLAKRIAQHFGLPYLDTGLLYRAVARDVMRARLHSSTMPGRARYGARALDPATLDDPRLRGRGCGRGRLDRRQHSRGARGAARIPARLRRAARRARSSTAATSAPWCARTPRLRSTSPPVRRCAPGGVTWSCRASAGAPTYEAVLADIERRDARDAGRERVAHAPGRRRHLARHHRLGYRSRIRRRCRIDQEEDRPIGDLAGPHERIVAQNSVWRAKALIQRPTLQISIELAGNCPITLCRRRMAAIRVTPPSDGRARAAASQTSTSRSMNDRIAQAADRKR